MRKKEKKVEKRPNKIDSKTNFQKINEKTEEISKDFSGLIGRPSLQSVRVCTRTNECIVLLARPFASRERAEFALYRQHEAKSLVLSLPNFTHFESV